MVGRVMAHCTVAKSVTWFGEFTYMVLDGMSAAPARVVFASCAGPVCVCSNKTGLDRRIAVTDIATTADIDNTIQVKHRIIKRQVIRIHVCVTGAAARCGMSGLRWIAVALRTVS